MSRFIINQAVACGGSARGFNQGARSMTCGVYASDWLASRINGKGDVFEKADRQAAVIQCAPTYFAGKAPSEVPDYYKIGETTDLDGTIKVLVQVCDYKPTKAYSDAATALKDAWGSVGANIKQKIKARLEDQAGLQMGGQAPTYNVSAPGVLPAGPDADTNEYQARQDLLGYFRQPGNNVWSLYPAGGGAGHIMATCCTADNFWIFDSQCGEAGIPLDQLGNWFTSEYVITYLNKYQSFGASSYVKQD